MNEESRARAMAASVLAHWGWADEAPRLVKWRENAVFEVTLRDGRRCALRLHRPGYQSRTAIEAELMWTERLADAGCPVPRPVRTVPGGLTATVGGRVASMVGWIAGEPIGSAAELPGTAEAQAATMRGLGMLIAAIHAATDTLDLPEGLARPRWDAAALLGPRPHWGRFWLNPALRPEEASLLRRARDEAKAALADLAGDADFGLIHADCLRENVLRAEAGGLALIDFDDSGWGFRMYDLGTALVQSVELPHVGRLAAALLSGYRARRAVPDRVAAALPLFVMLRAFASAGWIVSRAPPDDPRQRFYAERAVRMAASWLEGSVAWGAEAGG